MTVIFCDLEKKVPIYHLTVAMSIPSFVERGNILLCVFICQWKNIIFVTGFLEYLRVTLQIKHSTCVALMNLDKVLPRQSLTLLN